MRRSVAFCGVLLLGPGIGSFCNAFIPLTLNVATGGHIGWVHYGTTTTNGVGMVRADGSSYARISKSRVFAQFGIAPDPARGRCNETDQTRF
ncbi:hypothetical protein B0O80DRAFT_170746 [Mortierella sp. GBAus27b]|nr:hypothetical protein B0O80DRAFT_170746 [Mortierella sp. GBAus27b]